MYVIPLHQEEEEEEEEEEEGRRKKEEGRKSSNLNPKFLESLIERSFFYSARSNPISFFFTWIVIDQAPLPSVCSSFSSSLA